MKKQQRLMYLWRRHGTLYSGVETEALARGVAEALAEEFGPTTFDLDSIPQVAPEETERARNGDKILARHHRLMAKARKKKKEPLDAYPPVQPVTPGIVDEAIARALAAEQAKVVEDKRRAEDNRQFVIDWLWNHSQRIRVGPSWSDHDIAYALEDALAARQSPGRLSNRLREFLWATYGEAGGSGGKKDLIAPPVAFASASKGQPSGGLAGDSNGSHVTSHVTLDRPVSAAGTKREPDELGVQKDLIASPLAFAVAPAADTPGHAGTRFPEAKLDLPPCPTRPVTIVSGPLVSREVIERVKEEVHILCVVEEATRLRRHYPGSIFSGSCPFHEDAGTSLHVNPARGFFHCFACMASGNVIDFVMKRDGIGFHAAVHLLAQRLRGRNGSIRQ